MSENFKKIVNAPHRFMEKLRKKAWNAQADTAGKKTAKAVGAFVAGGTEFLFWLTKYALLDNHLLRKVESLLRDMNLKKDEQGKANLFAEFSKKYPDLSAHLMYYMMFVMIAGGVQISEYATDKIEEIKTERIIQEEKRGTFGAYLDKVRPLTPLLIADLIAKEGVRVNEQGLHIPYKDSRGIWTIGFGSTVLKDGTRVKKNTPPITDEQAYELARYHLENKETYYIMYCYDIANDNIDVNRTSMAFGLGSIFYNSYSKLVESEHDRNHKERFAYLRKLYKEYGEAVPDSLVKEAFQKYPIKNLMSFGEAWMDNQDTGKMADRLGEFLAGGNGLRWRRWLEAGLLTGDITPQMLLDCPVNGVFEFYKYMDKRKSAFFVGNVGSRQVNKNTYKLFADWLRNPVTKSGVSLKKWKKVSDYMPDDVVKICRSNHCVLGGDVYAWSPKSEAEQEKQYKIEVETFVLGYESLYADALAEFKNKNYKVAAKKYLYMINEYPNNALLRNDLAATYNNLGDYDLAIEQARHVLHIIGDKTQYAAAQYNAGVAYENMGNMQKALANYKLSLANGNKRAKLAIDRVTKLLNKSVDKRTSYNKAIQNVQNRSTSKQAGVYIKHLNSGRV